MRNEQKSRVFVTTPTGNIGKHVASALVERDVPISVLVREGSEKRLDQSVRDRAQVFTGAMSEADTVTQATSCRTDAFAAAVSDPPARAESTRSFATLTRYCNARARRRPSSSGVTRTTCR